MKMTDITYGHAAQQISPTVVMFYLVILMAILVISFMASWKVFVKAGKPGWAVFVPFYSSYCQFDIAFGNGWLFLLMLVPIVNIVIGIWQCFKLASAFGKGIGFGFGLLFLPLIFEVILGFGDAEYIGPQ